MCIFPVTFVDYYRLCTVKHPMTVKEYNRSVDDYADSLFRFIRADLRDDDRAHDVVQESFEKLWRHVSEIEFAVVKSWLFTTAYNGMIDIIRKEKRMTLVDDYKDYSMVSEAQYSDLNEILHEALSKLPEQQRTPVLLRDYEGYSYREIGEITGLSEAQVKINIYRGRVALKEYIGKIETVL